ncbi:MAG: glycerophosphodiester phosphodiesterase family protein [Propionicimonas sp.]
MLARDFPFLDRRFVAMAHRGGWASPADEARENTMYAFGRAVGMGYRYIETDVRTTADGHAVVFHDGELDRVTDAVGRIGDHNLAQLRAVRIAGIDPVPLLAEVLEAFPATSFNIDLKDDGSAAAVASILQRQSCAERVCVSSFSGSRMRAFRRLVPQVPTGVSPLGVAWAGFVPLLRRARIDSGVVFQVPAKVAAGRVALVRPDVVNLAHATGRVIHVWTVDDTVEMERLVALGVDGLISNDITALKQVLTGHGLWEDAA